MGREPIPVLRQILAACAWPELLESPSLPEAARDRARSILREMDAGNIGGYNHEHRSHKVPATVSRFLEFRDGVPCDPKNIILCSGVETVIPFVLSLSRQPPPARPAGVLVPVPGPALCAAAAGPAGVVPVPYPLDAARGRAPDEAAPRRELRGARGRCRPAVLWALNPGDPAGHVLSVALMRALLVLAAEESLLVLAAEVHQDLAFSPDHPFLSFRRILAELGPPLDTSVQIISTYSLSSGIAGGGARAGFLSLVNVERSVLREFHTWGLSVYPPVLGQVMLDVAVELPGHGDPAADAMEEALGLEPDVFFCRELEEATGLLVTPGSHFGLGGDSGHRGLSLLLPAPVLERALLLLRHFHGQFLREFS